MAMSFKAHTLSLVGRHSFTLDEARGRRGSGAKAKDEGRDGIRAPCRGRPITDVSALSSPNLRPTEPCVLCPLPVLLTSPCVPQNVAVVCCLDVWYSLASRIGTAIFNTRRENAPSRPSRWLNVHEASSPCQE